MIARKALNKAAYRDATFQPRQAHSGTLMDTQTEGEMPVVGTFKVKLIRVIENQRIPVGRGYAQRQQAAGFHVHMADSRGMQRPPVAQLVRWLKTQEFVYNQCQIGL